MEKDNSKRRCAECGKDILLGEDALALERIVMGPRGPVPLDDMKFFHIERCLEEYVYGNEPVRLPRRLP